MKKTLYKMFGVAAIAALIMVPTYAQDKKTTKAGKKSMKEKSLYDRLGGKKSIAAVVDEFVNRVAADKRINAFFAKDVANPAMLKKFKGHLVDQICQASGGPCKYTGKSMKEAHKGMGVSGADFNALVEDLVGALDKFKVDEKSKNDLLGALGPMKSDIVEK